MSKDKEKNISECAEVKKDKPLVISSSDLLNQYAISKYFSSEKIRVLHLRKSQRKNSVDSNFKIWSKSQALDVMKETAEGRQDLSVQWVEISKENVEFNKKYAGEDSEDYLVMKSLYDKYGKCILGQDGQQTFTVFNFLVLPLIGDNKNFEEITFTDEIVFKRQTDTKEVRVWEFGKNNEEYKISDWPDWAKEKIKDVDFTVNLYKLVLYRDISKIFENKNRHSSPNKPEIRTVSTNLISWVSSWITATDDEIKENFEIHEKSMPLSLKRGKGNNVFVSLEKEFGTNRGDFFEKWIGSNVRMANEELFQKLLVCTDTRVKNHKPGASIVNAKLLDKLVKTKITKTNYKEYKQKLKNQIDNFDIMFSMFESQNSEDGMKKLSTKTGFITDLNNLITDIKNNVEEFPVNYQLDGEDINTKIEVEFKFNLQHFKDFIESFVKEWNRLISIKELKEKGKTLTPNEQKDYDVIESTDSFQYRSIKKRTEHWSKWFKQNKNNFIQNGFLSVSDLKRFFKPTERVTSAVLDNYLNIVNNEKYNPIEIWDGNEYNTDHFTVSFTNGGFTILSNAKVLPANINKSKGGKNAKEYFREVSA